MKVLAKAVSVVTAFVLLAFSQRAVAQSPTTPATLIKPGSEWRGKLTQTGSYRGILGDLLELDCTLSITEGDGKTFKAELKEKFGTAFSLTYLVSGKVTPPVAPAVEPFIIEWTADAVKDLKNTAAIAGAMKYKGTLTTDTITSGKWSLVNPRTDTLQGGFEFSRVSTLSSNSRDELPGSPISTARTSLTQKECRSAPSAVRSLTASPDQQNLLPS